MTLLFNVIFLLPCTCFQFREILNKMENVNTVFEYTIIPGFRKNSKLLYIEKEEQIYKYKYTSRNIKYYYCYNKNCKVGVAVDFNNLIHCRKIKNSNSVHDHEKQNILFDKLKIINAINAIINENYRCSTNFLLT